MVYRERGGTKHVMVPKTALLSETYVRSTFRQAGATPEQIEAFLESCQKDVA